MKIHLKRESFRKFYKEKSNVFSYYILKFILLYNIDDTFIGYIKIIILFNLIKIKIISMNYMN